MARKIFQIIEHVIFQYGELKYLPQKIERLQGEDIGRKAQIDHQGVARSKI